MDKKLILNKREIVLYRNNSPMGAVTDFRIKRGSASKGLYEMLSATPWSQSDESECEIEIVQLLSEYESPETNSFSLRVVSQSGELGFMGCTVKSSEDYFDSSGRLVRKTVITAENMEE